jgi:hypothetical protein
LARPEGSDESRVALYGESLPELPASECIAEYWRELGYARESINGVAPVTWQELQAFAEIGGYAISPHEARCLIDMSRAYCVEIADRSHFRKPPMERET